MDVKNVCRHHGAMIFMSFKLLQGREHESIRFFFGKPVWGEGKKKI